MVYWSDVSEKTIHKANLDGSKHSIFLGKLHGLGVVDGKLQLPVASLGGLRGGGGMHRVTP